MDIFYKKLIKIFLVHIVFIVVYLYMCAVIEGGSFLRDICFFLTEPIFVFTIYLGLLYVIVYRILKKGPILSRKENIFLMIVSIIFTLISIYPVITFYVDKIVEYEYSIFVYKRYWGN